MSDNSESPSANGDPLQGRSHAVVIGGGMAGLLAARVLADHFARVTLIDRDELPEVAVARQSVPQGRHIHVLWAGGADVIEELFPGILSELTEGGANALDACHELRWFHHGVWKRQVVSPIVMHTQSRVFLEWKIRQRLAALPQVNILSKASVRGLCYDAQRQRVIGVELEQRGDSTGVSKLAADLVVDASGRGSRLPQWLKDLGYAEPTEAAVGIDLAYSSRTYHIPVDSNRDWKVMAVFARAPDSKRSGVIFPIEGGRWIVTLAGCLGDHPPGDENGFLEFARGLDRPDLYEAIRNAEPESPIVTYRFPHQLRRHYERLKRFPDGIVAVGDAMCSFNPLYGQGMSVCALEAKLLGELLHQANRRANRDCSRLPLHYFRRAKGIVDNPWLLATCSDYLYPSTTGHRPLGTAALGWYIVQLLELSEHDEKIVTLFHEVLHFLKPPTALFHPAVMFRAISWGLGRRGGRRIEMKAGENSLPR